MQRRQLITGAAALAAGSRLASPAIAGTNKVLTFVPTTAPPTYDPLYSPAQATRTLGLMIYEMLYSRDSKLNPHPHMVEGHTIEDNGKRWTMKLRPEQWFHDGTPVLARDCVASVKRWFKRDQIGGFIEGRLDSLEATDDRTLVWRLKKPFPFLAAALAKTQPTCPIMPERLCADPYKMAPECIGSGPFRWVKEEFVTSVRMVMAKWERYVPRPEPIEYSWGGYHVKLDRVEWRIMPDPATAANALVKGEIDWVENPLPDLLPMLKKAPGVTVGRLDTHGVFPVLRPNFIAGPTMNVAVRRAMLAAIHQEDEMTAVMGDDREGWKTPVGFFLPGTESATDVGMEVLRNRKSPDEIKRMLKDGGYDGEKIVLLHPTDPSSYDALCQVAEGAFQKVGLNVDVQTMDWGTLTQRRNNQGPIDKGGWSLFPSGFPAVDFGNPVLAGGIRTNGKDAWIGWPENAKIESLRDAWIDSDDAAERKRLSGEIQRECFDYVPFVPLGQYINAGAWRSNVTGQQRGPVPVFWNVEKA